MRHLRTRGDAYAFCSDYEKTTTKTTHSYRNVRCRTDNGGQRVGSFQQYPDCFTLRDLFNRIVDNFSGYPVFGYENNGSVEWITYSEFSVLVLNFAYAMKKMGIVPGQHVAVFIESSTWFALSQWALAYLGAVMVPIKDNEDKTVIPQIIKVLKSHVLICSERTVGRLSGIINEKTRLRTPPDAAPKLITAVDVANSGGKLFLFFCDASWRSCGSMRISIGKSRTACAACCST